MATTRGYGGTLGAGLETTFGTAVSRTTWAHAYAMALREMTVVEPIGCSRSTIIATWPATTSPARTSLAV